MPRGCGDGLTSSLSRMDSVDTRVILVAGDGGWSEGFDSTDDLKRLPSNYNGGIWTNRIDKIAPIIENRVRGISFPLAIKDSFH